MYIYRALNLLDEELDPTKVGLVSKEIINSVVVKSFDFLIYAESIKLGRDLLENLSNSDISQIYRDMRNKLVTGNNYEILEKAQNNQKLLNWHFENYIKYKDKDSYEYIMSIFKTINGHITNGSKKDYSWISFSTNPETIKRYYNEQWINRVVVVDSNIKTSFDICGNDILLAANLSNLVSINENPFLVNESNYKTALNYRGYNYSQKSNEVIYYNMVPKERIVTTLNSLEYELLINGLLSETYYNYSEFHKKRLQVLTLIELRKLFENECNIINYMLEEYYNKSNSLKYLAEQGIYDLNSLENANNYMMQKIKTKGLSYIKTFYN